MMARAMMGMIAKVPRPNERGYLVILSAGVEMMIMAVRRPGNT